MYFGLRRAQVDEGPWVEALKQMDKERAAGGVKDGTTPVIVHVDSAPAGAAEAVPVPAARTFSH